MSRVYPFSDDVYGDTVYAACTDICSNNCCSSSSSSTGNVSSSGSTGASSTTHVSGFNEHNGSVWNQDELLRPYTHPEYRLGDMIDTLDVKGLEPLQDYPLLSEDPLMARCWEVCQNQTMCDNQILDVQGRLKTAITFWVDILHVSSPVLDWVQEGYKLPLITLPPTSCQPNHKSAIDNEQFVTEALAELLAHRCIKEVYAKPYICSPLSVVTNDGGKKRLVINLKFLNQYLWKEHFKYEDLRTLMQMFTPEDYVFSFDLKSGYHHVDIFPEHWQYLGFSWGKGGRTRYYTFTVLPFGLSTACYVFTKLMRPLIRHWRGKGFRAIVYIDDGIVAAVGEQNALAVSNQVREDLKSAGFIVNVSKSKWTPAKETTWLGFDINLRNNQLQVPPYKIEALQHQLCHVITKPRLLAKELASLIGKIISMSLAFGPIARFMTRSLYATLNTRLSWFQQLEVTPKAKTELQFWLCNVHKYNGQNIWHQPAAMRLVYSDASSTGYGGYTVEHGPQVAHGQWSQQEMANSSTWRELCAVQRVLESLAPKLRNERLRWFSDNQNVVRILTVGSRQANLQTLALNIFTLCMANQIRLEPEWIPRKENEQADFISKIIDYDDWMLDPVVFAELDCDWGPHDVDRFADVHNKQLKCFNSRYWNPGSEAVDAFTCDWENERNWLCPPTYLINRVIQNAKVTKAEGTLIVPAWRSAPFWPILYPDGCNPADFIKKVRELPQREGLILPTRSGAVLFKGVPNTKVLALFINFANQVHPR